MSSQEVLELGTQPCQPSMIDNFDIETLRQHLIETIFRGRDNASHPKRHARVRCETPEEGYDKMSTLPCVSELGIAFKDFRERHCDVQWESVCLELDDKRDPSQCKLNVHLVKQSTHPSYTPLPTICLLHGTGASFDVEDVLNNAVRFARRGFLVVLSNSRYHGCRSGDGYEGKEHYLKALVESWQTNCAEDVSKNLYPFIYDTAADLSSVADYLQSRHDVSKQQLGITGISLGGMHAWFAAAADTRWRAVGPLIGVHCFKYAVEEMCFEARVATIQEVFDVAAKDMGEEEVTAEVVQAVWNRICPGLLERFDGGNALGLLCPRPVFIANGGEDARCPVEGVVEAVRVAREVYERECGEPQKIELGIYEGVGHEVTEEMWEDCVRFFEKVFDVKKREMK